MLPVRCCLTHLSSLSGVVVLTNLQSAYSSQTEQSEGTSTKETWAETLIDRLIIGNRDVREDTSRSSTERSSVGSMLGLKFV